MTGIACGNGYNSGGVYSGVAPNSYIISVKILDSRGRGNSAQALAGIEWIISNRRKYNIKIANMSIGTGERSVNLPLMKAVSAAWESGITVVAASGNTGSRSTAITSPGLNPRVITVGCYEDFCLPGRRELNSCGVFAKTLPKPDILSPGENIVSVMSPDYSFNTKAREAQKPIGGAYITMSGTSMATPMVTGAAALLLEQNPSLTPDDIKSIIASTARHCCCSFDKGILNIGGALSSMQ